MSTPLWVDIADALAIHEKMIAQHGGSDGLRDKGLLESALAKPQHRFRYENAAIPNLAASYAAGVILNHPFIDGNKRTGFLLAVAFIEINGLRFTAAEVDAVVQTLALAAGACTEADYATWLSQNSNPNSPR